LPIKTLVARRWPTNTCTCIILVCPAEGGNSGIVVHVCTSFLVASWPDYYSW
jgi:hypothetical protein